jgi:hypothetical protein
MVAMGGYDPSAAIRAAVQADPCVRSVELTGSRAEGTATDLSDWDYRIVSADPVATAGRLPGLAAALNPLAALWDPLSSQQVYMIIMAGAVKADLFPGLPCRPAAGPLHEVTPVDLPAIDAHFWDWTLWLGAKRLRGLDALVAAELAKMWRYLLRPLGATCPPGTQYQAITSYLRLRRQHEQRLRVTVAPDLGAAVITRLQTAGLLSPGLRSR